MTRSQSALIGRLTSIALAAILVAAAAAPLVSVAAGVVA